MHTVSPDPTTRGKLAGVLFALMLIAFVVESQLTQVKRGIFIQQHVPRLMSRIVCPNGSRLPPTVLCIVSLERGVSCTQI